MIKGQKILIDTDIGDEIDDALALYLAMCLNFDIVGVTTVFQNTCERARMAKKLMREFGNGYESVPVYAGYGDPLQANSTEHSHTCQYSKDLDNNIFAPDSTEPEQAVDFIIECCKKYGKALTVVAIGPFTNIALALKKSPHIFDLVDRVVIMGGAYFKQYADWNVMCDVEAADVMFQGIKNLECIGADVTHLLDIGEENYKALLSNKGTGAIGYVCDLMRLWKDHNPSRNPVLHDPLVISYINDCSVCVMEDQTVTVITGGFARGITLNVDAYNKAYLNELYQGVDLQKKTRVAYGVDKKKVIDDFMSYFR